jgi:hypothetical protein
MQQRVLVRRAGLRGFQGRTRRQVARNLGLSRRRVTRIEHRALRSLRRAVRTGGCSGAAPISSASTSTTTPASAASTAAEGTQGGPATGATSASTGAAADRQEVKGVSQSGGGESPVERVLKAGPRVVAAAPRTVANVTSEARSYADDHPIAFALAVLVTLLAAALLVRELRRAV